MWLRRRASGRRRAAVGEGGAEGIVELEESKDGELDEVSEVTSEGMAWAEGEIENGARLTPRSIVQNNRKP